MNNSDRMEFDTNLEIAYRLLSACLYQPAAEWADEGLFQNLGEALRVVAPAAAEKADIMGAAFKESGCEALTVAYAALFVGPSQLLAPPYGSFYMEPEKRVMGETTMAAHAFYLECGLRLDDDFSELPDHMAVELEFASYLLQRAIQAAGEGDTEGYDGWVERRRHFLHTFLAGWYNEFCNNIRNGAEDGFYSALADCLEAVVTRDGELLTALR
ncbi:MAG: molecular chaperone TorD family protein [Deltaproteobacteria bacterium]|nr:molecular chaperone TorD family protein [Deltaproteobacteria bacterium]